jgi:intracellular septation protein
MSTMSEADRAKPEQEQKQEPPPPSLAKLAIELGPLLAFFLVNAKWGLMTATAVLMVTTVVSLVASRVVLGHVATMPIVTAVVVLVFGALTLWLDDKDFIKLKPTIVYGLMAAVLGGGLLFGRSLLSHVLGEALRLTDEGWRKLTLRWALFFLAMAVLNEVVWRTVSDDTWVAFKVFGFLPITMAFAIAQVGLMKRHAA